MNWSQSEFWPREWSAQRRTLAFFQQLDADLVDSVGVVTIEGEHPGSTYYAAELRMPISNANEAAALLGPPFRVRDE